MRVAAYDCGTNSLRLLIADLDPATGAAEEVVRDMRIVRLGEGVDRTGRISEAAMARVLAAVEEYAATARDHGVERSRFCATSAARDAENGPEFIEQVRSLVGVTPEIIAGEEEAQLSFAGAVRSVGTTQQPPYLVADIGGGSTELIIGESDVEAARSLDIGSVRLTERHLHSDPPTPAEVRAAVEDIDRTLDRVDGVLDLAGVGTVIGVAGTVTTIAAAALELPSYQRERIHHARIDVPTVLDAVDRLVSMSVAERRDLGYMHPGRADVIGGGGLVLARLLERAPVGAMLVSEHDILDGIAWSMLPPTTQ